MALYSPALARFGVGARRIRRLTDDVVRVDADDGRTFALRCRKRADRAFGNIPLELSWMEALRRDTEIEPPDVVTGLDGLPIQEVEFVGEVEPRDCVLFQWVPGTALAKRLTPRNVRALGVLAAQTHEHAARFSPPSHLPVRLLDRLVRGDEHEVLFSHEHQLFLPPARRVVFEAVAGLFRTELLDLYAVPWERRVIHADLNHENVKVDRGRLRPLDFYEVIWGYPIQDIALTFWDLRYYANTRPHGYSALRDAFENGYRSRRAWPESRVGQIDLHVAGRRLRQANWVLVHETARFAEDPARVPDPDAIVRYFERIEAEFRTLLSEHAPLRGAQ